MKTRIFISKANRGWEEVQVPERFNRYSYDALISIMHQFIDINQYKGVLITENPNPTLTPN